MFRLHGDGRDQGRAHGDRAVSGPRPRRPRSVCRTPSVVTSSVCLQVQEAPGLQEEEAAAADKEAAVPAPPSDVAHGQLRARRLELLNR